MAEKKQETVTHDFEPSKQDIQSFARCLFPMIKAYYDSEEGQREFAEWKARQSQGAAQDKS